MSLLLAAFLLVARPSVAASQSVWDSLNSTVGGRLHTAAPFSSPCFPDRAEYDEALCHTIQANYANSTYRASQYNGYSVTEWEGCRALGEQCLLNYANTSDPSAWTDYECAQGSIAPYYIEVAELGDVQAAFSFAAKTGVPLSIKNSGHDFLGRSTVKGSLGIWTHGLQNLSYSESFVPEGSDSDESYSAMTIGAGVSWDTAYRFADQHNVTVVGGYHETVGASGGWVMGGGHSILSPVYGLGVDRVLEFKIVTPDGQLRTANAYTNTDLFWALRGGGGGTYGVVLESTTQVEPQMTLQVVSLAFNRTEENAPEFLKIVVDNSLQWAEDGWGGHIRANGIINVTPLLNNSQAQASVKAATDYALSQNGTAIVEEVPSWFAFYEKYVLVAQGGIGYGAISGSWLIPGGNFTTDAGREAIYDALVATLPYGNPNMIQVGPYLYNHTQGATSTTEAWRGSIWHAIFYGEVKWNGTKVDDETSFDTMTNLTANFKAIAPQSGSYMNEGDVREKDWQRSYWGDNYPRLLEIKNKYDPNRLLDCHMCVGWSEEDSESSCYLS